MQHQSQSQSAQFHSIEQTLAELERVSTVNAFIFSEKNKTINERNRQHFEALAKKKANAEKIAQKLAQRAQEKKTRKTQASLKPKGIGRISYTRADEAFSLCVRLRANCTCERCNKRFHYSNMKELHCSHNYSRENKALRYHPDNAFALCQDCHRWFSRYKIESTAWMIEKLGEPRYHALIEAMGQPPQTSAQVNIEEQRAKAYYNLLARQLLKQRQQGNSAYLAFEGMPKRLILTSVLNEEKKMKPKPFDLEACR